MSAHTLDQDLQFRVADSIRYMKITVRIYNIIYLLYVLDTVVRLCSVHPWFRRDSNGFDCIFPEGFPMEETL